VEEGKSFFQQPSRRQGWGRSTHNVQWGKTTHCRRIASSHRTQVQLRQGFRPKGFQLCIPVVQTWHGQRKRVRPVIGCSQTSAKSPSFFFRSQGLLKALSLSTPHFRRALMVLWRQRHFEQHSKDPTYYSRSLAPACRMDKANKCLGLGTHRPYQGHPASKDKGMATSLWRS
jgi:hypothetical protein